MLPMLSAVHAERLHGLAALRAAWVCGRDMLGAICPSALLLVNE